MQPKDKTRVVTFGNKAHDSIGAGVEKMRKAVGSTYGPGGRNVLIKKKYIQPILTRDGVTVARDIAGHGNKLEDPIASEAAKLVYQASEKTNKTAGDGTTATVVTLAAVYRGGRQQVAAGQDAMVIKRKLDESRAKIVKFVESKSQKCDKEKLDQVAAISAGDEQLGLMISDLMHDVGSEGTVTIEYQNAPQIEVEKVTGYLFGKGFKNLAVDIEFAEPIVFVTQKRITTKSDIVPILDACSAHQEQVMTPGGPQVIDHPQRQFIIVGDVSGAAFETLMWALQNQKADGLVIPPPAYGDDGHDYFEDIATYTGARLWMESDSFSDITIADFGSVKRSRVSRDKAILFGDNETGNAIAERISSIQKLMNKSGTSLSLKEVYEQRIAKLAGKVSIIKVGAATETERDELFFRVEDAVEACKSALSSGVVAGGATTLLFASEKVEGLEPFVREALQQPFRLLMSNAVQDGGYRLNQVLNAGYGKGFNLRDNLTTKSTPVDLIEVGVVDATKVIVQVVQNAFSVAAALLTTGAVITEEDDDSEPVNP